MSADRDTTEPVRFTCAICQEEESPDTVRVLMPCCGRADSSVQFCRRCIEIIAERGIEGRIGRCPICLKCYSIADGVIQTTEQRSQCSMCCQMKVIADTRRQFCDQCLLGHTYSFTYECARCHRLQRIPHPMWKYQATPTDFGTASWACHQVGVRGRKDMPCRYTSLVCVCRGLLKLFLQ
jgi:hypothetical protein